MKNAIRVWLLLTLGILAAHAQRDYSRLYINEIQVANIDQFVDPSYNYGGWVEFYNAGEEAVTLTSLYVSDRADSLKMFRLPSGVGSVPADGYKNIWFGHNNKGSDHYSPKATQQVSFNLNPEGGTIYISDPNGNLLMQQTYPAAVARCSYARRADGGEDWEYTYTPSPQATNNASQYAYKRLEAPVVSRDGGVVDNGTKVTFKVQIPAGCTLRYTTDGTAPTMTNGETSSTGQFTVTATTVYRFCLTRNGYLPSPVVTRSFIYKNHDYYLPVVSVVTNPKNLYDNTIGIYVQGTNGQQGNGPSSDPARNWNMDWDRPVNVELMVPEVNQEGKTSFLTYVNQETDMEICGGWSRSYGGGYTDGKNWQMKASFRLKTDKQYELQNSFDYSPFPHRPYNKYKAWQLRNGGNDTYARIKDQALHQMVIRSGFYIDCQDSRPAHVFFNGQYLGLLNIREPNNKHFSYGNYGIDLDDLDQFELAGNSYKQKVGDNKAWLELVALARELSSNPSEENYRRVRELLDVDEFVNYMAYEAYMGSNDWISNNNNVKGFRSRSDDGRFHLVLFDVDAAFSYDNMVNMLTNNNYNANVDDLFRYLIKYEPFKRQFITAYCLVNGSVLDPNRATDIVMDIYSNIQPALQFEGNNSSTSLANTIRQAHDGTRMTSLKNTYKLGNPCQLDLSTNLPSARLLINGQEVPYNAFSGKLFDSQDEGPVLTAKAPAGYRFAGWTKPAGAQQVSIIANGDQWNYYDKGSMDAVDWTAVDFNPASRNWSTGQAPMGYANSGKYIAMNSKTKLDYGTDANNKRPTYYFRKEFTLTKAPTSDEKYVLTYQVDDGCRIFLNGRLLTTYNCNADAKYSNYSITYEGDEPHKESVVIPNSELYAGKNVIAVDVHNNSGSSSDIFFGLTLSVTSDLADVVCMEENLRLNDYQQNGACQLKALFEPIADADERLAEGGAPIRINEVSAGNDIYVNDLHKKNDWIELYNTTDQDINLAGMYITDNTRKPTKWQVTPLEGSPEATIIPAHGTRIVWCDKLEPVSQLHAPFKLDNADGATVGIQAQDGSWSDALTYMAQPRWYTYGRFPNGGNHHELMSCPTIDASNRLAVADVDADAADRLTDSDITITLALAQGWNWTSHNMNESFGVGRFTAQAQTLRGQLTEFVNDPELGWQGQLQALDAATGYKLQMLAPIEVTLRGSLYDTQKAVELTEGWNWIACPLYNATELRTALANYEAAEGDCLVGMDAFALFEDGQWEGTLTQLEPGQGYLLRTSRSQSFCWNALSGAQARYRRYAPLAAENDSRWMLDIHAYPNVMAVVARLADGEPWADGEYQIGFFCGDECRGVATLVDGLLYANVHGVGGEALSVRLMNQEGTEYQGQQLQMQDQRLLGSRQNPYLLYFTQDGVSAPMAQGANESSPTYNLQGQQVGDDYRGLVISKGRKELRR